MVAGTKHIKLQYEWSKKLQSQPYNCDIVNLEHRVETCYKDYIVDVYGKNSSNGNEYVIEIGEVPEQKEKMLKEKFGSNFIYIPYSNPSLTETANSVKINLRVPKNIYTLLKNISFENNKTLTSNIIYFLENGIVRVNILDKLQNFLNEQEVLMMQALNDERLTKLSTEVKVFERDKYKCRKCGSKQEIVEIPLPSELIGKTFAGLDCESKITLCKNCFYNLRKYIPKRYELERFLEWYYK
jgi:hypothetical protein